MTESVNYFSFNFIIAKPSLKFYFKIGLKQLIDKKIEIKLQEPYTCIHLLLCNQDIDF